MAEIYPVLLVRRAVLLLVVLVLSISDLAVASVYAQEEDKPRRFDNGNTLDGRFLEYWEENGGLDTFGLPISNELEEKNANGQTYTVQYFAYAVFELHTENRQPYDVLLTPLGSELFRHNYPEDLPDEKQDKSGQYFGETKKWVGSRFLDFWKGHGGTPVLGLPISNEVTEISQQDGKQYPVQYFERAVLEYRRAEPFEQDVHPRDLGRQRWIARYGSWLDKFLAAPASFLTRLLTDNQGLRVLGIPAFVAALAVGFDLLISRNKGRRRSPEPFLAFALNMPILALGVDLTAQVENQQQATVITAAVVLHLAFLVVILGFIKLARDRWAEQEELPADQRSGVATWTWTWIAVLAGLLSLVISFWAITLA